MSIQPHPIVCYLVSTAREQRMSLREVERRAGIGANVITRWVRTGRTPDLDVINKALGIFNLRTGVVSVFPLDRK